MFDVLYADQPGILGEGAVPSPFPGVWIVPADEQLGRVEVEALVAPEMRLKTAAYGSEAFDNFDVVLIDMPPALGSLTLKNGLVAADAVITVTTTPQAFAVQGLVAFLQSVAHVRGRPHLNPNLRVEGVLVNQFDGTGEHTYQLDQIREAYGEALLSPIVPKRTGMRRSERPDPVDQGRQQGCRRTAGSTHPIRIENLEGELMAVQRKSQIPQAPERNLLDSIATGPAPEPVPAPGPHRGWILWLRSGPSRHSWRRYRSSTRLSVGNASRSASSTPPRWTRTSRTGPSQLQARGGLPRSRGASPLGAQARPDRKHGRGVRCPQAGGTAVEH